MTNEDVSYEEKLIVQLINEEALHSDIYLIEDLLSTLEEFWNIQQAIEKGILVIRKNILDAYVSKEKGSK